MSSFREQFFLRISLVERNNDKHVLWNLTLRSSTGREWNWENGAKRLTEDRLHFYLGSTFRLCKLLILKRFVSYWTRCSRWKRKSTWVLERCSPLPQTDSYTTIYSIIRRIFLSQAHSPIKGSLWRRILPYEIQSQKDHFH